MTRDEQILKAGEETASNPFELEGFIEGAEWADDHPDLYSVTRKAVERERKYLIDKAFNFLIERYENQGAVLLEDINELKSIMEE